MDAVKRNERGRKPRTPVQMQQLSSGEHVTRVVQNAGILLANYFLDACPRVAHSERGAFGESRRAN